MANDQRMYEDEIRTALAWLNEAVPNDAEFDRLVQEGARGDEIFTMKLDGDDLASFCHSVQTLYDYFGWDRDRKYTHNINPVPLKRFVADSE